MLDNSAFTLAFTFNVPINFLISFSPILLLVRVNTFNASYGLGYPSLRNIVCIASATTAQFASKCAPRAALYNIPLAVGQRGWIATEAEMYKDSTPENDFDFGFSLGSIDAESGLTIGSPTHFRLTVLATPTVEQTVSDATGIYTITRSLPFSLYPNPAKESVYLDFVNKTGSETIVKIIDIKGKIVKQHLEPKYTGFGRIKMNISDLPAGNYLIELINDNKHSTTKFIIE